MLKLKDIPKIIPVWQRDRTGIWASWRARMPALCAAAFLCEGLAGEGRLLNSSEDTGVHFTWGFFVVFFLSFFNLSSSFRGF